MDWKISFDKVAFSVDGFPGHRSGRGERLVAGHRRNLGKTTETCKWAMGAMILLV